MNDALLDIKCFWVENDQVFVAVRYLNQRGILKVPFAFYLSKKEKLDSYRGAQTQGIQTMEDEAIVWFVKQEGVFIDIE